MNFRTRLMAMNSVIVIAMLSILGTVFYRYSAGVLEDNAETNIEIISQKMSQQLDDLIRQMDFVSLYTASNQSFITAVNVLATIDKQIPENFVYINQSRSTISGLLRSYAIGAKFYSLNLFSDSGEFQTSNFLLASIPDAASVMKNSPWIEEARNQYGKFIILPHYDDPWDTKNNAHVFGLVRALQGGKNGLGFLEVQNKYERLEALFSLTGLSYTEVVAVMGNGQIFYSSNPESFGLDFLADLEKNKDYNHAATVSDYTGIKVVIAQNKSALLEPLHVTLTMTLTVGIIIAALSICSIYILSRTITKPLRNLMTTMEQTSVENLSDAIEITQENDEIAALETVFAQMRERLTDAIAKENHAQRLQMQAHFDSLQAQVNPHFIYNILTVLSSRGLMSGNIEICEICESIGAMLRYSTSTNERYATIGEEITYAKTYLQLQKKRFEHKLDFSINIDSAILDQKMPKIVIQQLVENSINHGFENVSRPMEIEIKGYCKNNWWYVTVRDNGQGFPPEVLESLTEKIDILKSDGHSLNNGMGIGGMGLINACARLALYCGGGFEFKIGREDGRTSVTIGGVRKERHDENSIG